MIVWGLTISGGGVALPLAGGLVGLAGVVEMGRVRGISMRGMAGRGVSARDTADLGTGPPGIGIFVPGREPPAEEGWEEGFRTTGLIGGAGAAGGGEAWARGVGIDGEGELAGLSALDSGESGRFVRAGGVEVGAESGAAPVYGFSTDSAMTSISRSANSIQSPSPTISTPDVGRPLRRVGADAARFSMQSVSGSRSRKMHWRGSTPGLGRRS